MLTKVAFEGGAVADVGAVGVFEVGQFADQRLFEFLFDHDYRLSGASIILAPAESFWLHAVRLRKASVKSQRTTARSKSGLFVSVIAITSSS